MKLWTLEQDQLLIQLLEEYDGDFNKVGTHFPDKSVGAIRIRFHRIDPGVKSGKWDSQEDIKLVHWVFDDSIIRVDSCVGMFEGRRRNDVENRVKYYKKLIFEHMFPDYKLRDIQTICRTNNGTRKRVKKEERKVKWEGSKNHKIETLVKKTKNLINNIKSETVWKPLRSFELTSEALNIKFTPKLALNQFINLSNINSSSVPDWSKQETDQMFELYKTLKDDWHTMHKLITTRSPESIKTHFQNALKYAAFEYSNDINSELGVLSQLFGTHSDMVLKDPLNATEEELAPYTPIASYITLNASDTVESAESGIYAKVKLEQDALSTKFNDFREYLDKNDGESDGSDSSDSDFAHILSKAKRAVPGYQ